ncbi:glycosyltransferase family 4 protein [Winogradskyella forsetii]|uniref:glycosyltransferase family 4 protein n=1 Tax=Winogradskyella forsetii TaxID=2686077 RepID=UPI0015BB6644|nr:glycosyltransferase family 4 protein [Winogradskyella forsetii]
MKIALVLAEPPGYSETFFNSKIKGLLDNGHKVTLYTANVSDNYDLCKHIKHPAIHQLKMVQVFVMIYYGFTLLPHIKSVKRFFQLERKQGTPSKRIIEKIYLNAALLKYKGDWIHYGFATTALNRELVSEAVRAKMAVSLRGYDVNVYPLKHNNCYDLLWRKVHKVHTISKYLLNKAYSLGLDKGKSYQVINPAVNLENLPKRFLNQDNNKLKIVTIARFNWVKGLEYLTEVAVILKTKGIDFEWTLIGTGNSSEKERFLFDINQKQLNDQLLHKGECSHLEALNILSTSDLYVQTSIIEGFCNAILEAQAMGIPCVAFNVGGIPENISDQKTGWLIKPYDVKAMADKIYAISLLTPNEKTELSKNAISRILQNFSLEQQKQDFQKFYSI